MLHCNGAWCRDHWNEHVLRSLSFQCKYRSIHGFNAKMMFFSTPIATRLKLMTCNWFYHILDRSHFNFFFFFCISKHKWICVVMVWNLQFHGFEVAFWPNWFLINWIRNSFGISNALHVFFPHKISTKDLVPWYS